MRKGESCCSKKSSPLTRGMGSVKIVWQDAMLDLRASCMSNANGFLRIWLGSKWRLTQNSGWRVVSHQR